MKAESGRKRDQGRGWVLCATTSDKIRPQRVNEETFKLTPGHGELNSQCFI